MIMVDSLVTGGLVIMFWSVGARHVASDHMLDRLFGLIFFSIAYIIFKLH